MTKYDMAIAMAEAFNIPSGRIVADKSDSGGAKRPFDAHLDSARLVDLGICHRRPFKDAIKECLKQHYA